MSHQTNVHYTEEFSHTISTKGWHMVKQRFLSGIAQIIFTRPAWLTLSQFWKIVALDICDKIHRDSWHCVLDPEPIVLMTLQGYLLFRKASKALWLMWQIIHVTSDTWEHCAFDPETGSVSTIWTKNCVFPAMLHYCIKHKKLVCLGTWVRSYIYDGVALGWVALWYIIATPS